MKFWNKPFILSSALILSCYAHAAEVKGLLPELKPSVDADADTADKTNLKSELLITQAENQAIQSLNVLIKRNPNDPQLWYRLAELQMRRAKSGRYFDLIKNNKNILQYAPSTVLNESADKNLKSAIDTYTHIEGRFPRFEQMDAVLFNNAFAHQQLRKIAKSQDIYSRLIARFPNSDLIPDAVLAMAEMEYDKGNFKKSLVYFEKMEQYPESRLFAYAMYKSSWAYYNQRENEKGITKLVQVIQYFDSKKNAGKSEFNVRHEAVRDLELFYSDSRPANEAYSFFSKLLPNEYGQSLVRMANLYMSHSRHKEILTFLGDLNKYQPNSQWRVDAELKIAESFENLRSRDGVIEHLKLAQSFCSEKSKWLDSQKEAGKESCDKFRSFSTSTASKWWDLYQKNKQHKQIAELTEKIFAILLENQPNDLKIQHTYAEMLFQLARYDQAHEYYLNVSRKTEDKVIAHDSMYASLVCLEKLPKAKNDDVLKISAEYVKRFPEGEFASDVTLKMAVLQFKNKNYEDSKDLLSPLLKKGNPEIKQKAQDLMVEVLNAEGDFNELHKYVRKIDRKEMSSERVTHLDQIQNEAQFAGIGQAAKETKVDKTIQEYLDFSQNNQSSPLAQKALWQAISLSYAQKEEHYKTQGAELSLQYVKQYPKDEKSMNALKESFRILVMQKSEKAIPTVDLLIERSPKSERNILLLQKYELLQIHPSSEFAKQLPELEKELVSLNVEPIKSQFAIKQAKAVYESGDMPKAYKMAMDLVRRNMPGNLKSEAYLLYAQILEKEFFQQSTKTSIDRLPTVIALKTEKLDKAQSAYINALKAASAFEFQTNAIDGLIRCYSHYIDAISKPELKESPTPEEQNALNNELAQLIAPIKAKYAEFVQKKQSLTEEYKSRTPAAKQEKERG